MLTWSPAGSPARSWQRAAWISPVASVGLPAAAVVAAAQLTGAPSLLELVVIAAGATLLAILAAIDAATRTIPNVLVLPAVLIVLAAAALHPDLSFGSAFTGALAASGPFALAFYATPRFVRARAARRVHTSAGRGTNSIAIAAVAGMTGVLGTGLAHADVPAALAVASAIVAGTPLLLLSARDADGAAAARPSGASGIGGGDVKLAALVGAVAGIPGVVAALTIAMVGAACAAAAVLVVQRGGWFPYGPFLSAGAAAALVIGVA